MTMKDDTRTVSDAADVARATFRMQASALEDIRLHLVKLRAAKDRTRELGINDDELTVLGAPYGGERGHRLLSPSEADAVADWIILSDELVEKSVRAREQNVPAVLMLRLATGVMVDRMDRPDLFRRAAR